MLKRHPTKEDCPGHVAGRDAIGRYPLGDCSPDCYLRLYRLGVLAWADGEWANAPGFPQPRPGIGAR